MSSLNFLLRSWLNPKLKVAKHQYVLIYKSYVFDTKAMPQGKEEEKFVLDDLSQSKNKNAFWQLLFCFFL